MSQIFVPLLWFYKDLKEFATLKNKKKLNESKKRSHTCHLEVWTLFKIITCSFKKFLRQLKAFLLLDYFFSNFFSFLGLSQFTLGGGGTGLRQNIKEIF